MPSVELSSQLSLLQNPSPARYIQGPVAMCRGIRFDHETQTGRIGCEQNGSQNHCPRGAREARSGDCTRVRRAKSAQRSERLLRKQILVATEQQSGAHPASAAGYPGTNRQSQNVPCRPSEHAYPNHTKSNRTPNQTKTRLHRRVSHSKMVPGAGLEPA